MKYTGMPFGMWTLFAPSFRNQLTAVFGYGTNTAKAITKKAKSEYRRIIAGLPEFEKGDRFKMNLVNCAMIGAFILSMPELPKVDRLTDYYAKSMMTKPIFAIHDLMSRRRYGDMQAFVQKLRDMGYERVELIDTTDGSFMTPKEARGLMLRGSTLLVGRK